MSRVRIRGCIDNMSFDRVFEYPGWTKAQLQTLIENHIPRKHSLYETEIADACELILVQQSWWISASYIWSNT